MVFLQKMIFKKILILFLIVYFCNKSFSQYAPAPPGVNPQLYQQQQHQVL